MSEPSYVIPVLNSQPRYCLCYQRHEKIQASNFPETRSYFSMVEWLIFALWSSTSE